MKSTKHYHAMNGEAGCLPDNNEIFHSKNDAIEYLADLFNETRGVKADLKNYGICYRELCGADYCEVTVCYEQECLDYADSL